MARGRVKPRTQKLRRQAQHESRVMRSFDRVLSSAASRPQGVEKRPQRPLRRSARLAVAQKAQSVGDTPRESLPFPPTKKTLSKKVRRPFILVCFVLALIKCRSNDLHRPVLGSTLSNHQSESLDTNENDRKKIRGQTFRSGASPLRKRHELRPRALQRRRKLRRPTLAATEALRSNVG